jgi:hypothetical protein
MSRADCSEARASARPDTDLDRRHPVHLSAIELHNRPVIIFVTTCTAKRRAILASSSARCHSGLFGHGIDMASWRVRDHIRPHPFFLRTEHPQRAVTRAMDAVLETSRDQEHGRH